MLKPSLLFSTVIFLFFNIVLFGQSKGINREKYRINTTETHNIINVDGILDEPDWLTADKATHFQRVLPTDTGFAISQTEVKVIYNQSTLYVGIICYDSTPGKRPVESLRRDFNFPKNDNFIVFMDTYNDQTNGFAFGVSSAGAQWDGINQPRQPGPEFRGNLRHRIVRRVPGSRGMPTEELTAKKTAEKRKRIQ